MTYRNPSLDLMIHQKVHGFRDGKRRLNVPVYTVTKPVGTKDREFEAYTRLLEEVGIDVSNSPRVAESGTDNRWLYAWKKKIEAERFATELRRRTGDRTWGVYEFEDAAEDYGPVAPLDIASVPEEEGFTYYLTPASRERVVAVYPGTRLPGGLAIAIGAQQDLLGQGGVEAWMEICRLLTGRTDEEIDSLGGVRVIVGEDTVAFQRIPTATAI
jgi:hypothetical protein